MKTAAISRTPRPPPPFTAHALNVLRSHGQRAACSAPAAPAGRGHGAPCPRLQTGMEAEPDLCAGPGQGPTVLIVPLH